MTATNPVLVHPRPDLGPPLERALTQFADELRKELSNARTQLETTQAELAALRAEVTTLRNRYETHTHGYTRTMTGSGGNMWFDLRLLRNYLDGGKGNFESYGVYLREGGVTGSAPEVRTGTPSP